MGLGLLPRLCTLTRHELGQSWKPFLNSGSTLWFSCKAWAPFVMDFLYICFAAISETSTLAFLLLTCLQTSLKSLNLNLSSISEQSYISVVHVVIFSMSAINNNKLGFKFLPVLCGMFLTLSTPQAEPGFQGSIALVTPTCLIPHPNPSLALFPSLKLSAVER